MSIERISGQQDQPIKLSPGLDDFLKRVSQGLPDPEPTPLPAPGGAGKFSGGPRPPVLVATAGFDRDEEPRGPAQELARKFTTHWTNKPSLEMLEEGDRGFGRETKFSGWVRDQERQLVEVLDQAKIVGPAKEFLVVVHYELLTGGESPSTVVDFEALAINPVLMFVEDPKQNQAIDQALFTHHAKIIDLTEQVVLGSSPSSEAEELSGKWAMDEQLLQEQKELHQEWFDALNPGGATHEL